MNEFASAKVVRSESPLTEERLREISEAVSETDPDRDGAGRDNMSDIGDWYCRNCGYLPPSRVTNAETCDTCHEPVVVHSAERDAELSRLREEVERLTREYGELKAAIYAEPIAELDHLEHADVLAVIGDLSDAYEKRGRIETAEAESAALRGLVEALSARLVKVEEPPIVGPGEVVTEAHIAEALRRAERDWPTEEQTRQRAEYVRGLEKRVEALEGALLLVEWGGVHDPGGSEECPACPWCDESREYGHLSDCRFRALLAPEPRAEEPVPEACGARTDRRGGGTCHLPLGHDVHRADTKAGARVRFANEEPPPQRRTDLASEAIASARLDGEMHVIPRPGTAVRSDGAVIAGGPTLVAVEAKPCATCGGTRRVNLLVPGGGVTHPVPCSACGPEGGGK